MDIKAMKSEKFSEELYFLLMSSQLKERIHALGTKHGLSRKDIRDEIHSFGDSMVEHYDISVQDPFPYLLRQAV